jgi:SLOG family YspA-like protein
MNLVIFGSRSVAPTVADVQHAIVTKLDYARISLVISGTAPGGDLAGEAWAAHHGVPVRRMPANWSEFGKVAGKMRNGEMAAIADAGLGFWDGMSNGTADMAARLLARGKRCVIVECEPVKKQSAQGMLL